jgi:hypothetical protein
MTLFMVLNWLPQLQTFYFYPIASKAGKKRDSTSLNQKENLFPIGSK